VNTNSSINTDIRISPDDKVNKINNVQPPIFKFKIKKPEIRKTSENKNPIFKTFKGLNTLMQNYCETPKTKIEKDKEQIPIKQPQILNINLIENNNNSHNFINSLQTKFDNDKINEIINIKQHSYNENFKPESNKTTNKTTAGTDKNENILSNNEINKIFENYNYNYNDDDNQKENIDPNNNKEKINKIMFDSNNKIFEEDFNIKFDSFDEKDLKNDNDIIENNNKNDLLLLTNELDKPEKENNNFINLEKLDKLYNEDLENNRIIKENKDNRLLIEELKDFIINMKEDKYASSSEDDVEKEKESENKNSVYPTYSELNVMANKGL
jgi:hypothetical protein